MKTLYIDQDIIGNEPDIIVDPISLSREELQSLEASRSSIFWFKHRKWSPIPR